MANRSCFPHFAAGLVVKGFGRGSKELGIPTANFPDEVVSSLPSSMGTGIYYGLARVVDGPIHKMVMSVGWNPYYHNTKKSMVTHRAVRCCNKFGSFSKKSFTDAHF
ncbi:Riboflavin kinase domain bacterial/eukaryotic [Trinorchestia longiramus]|nr:Riboflavin kinase domain bacterial/eukaryotic [Trinorchestia longiramus]